MKCISAVMFTGMFGIGLFAADNVKFTTGEWEPYTGQKMEGYGMVTEIVTAACNAEGITADYEFLPWRRAENYVENGSSFATFPYQKTKERVGKFYFSEILCSSSMGILAHQGNAKTADFEYSKPEDLKRFHIGIVAGTDAVKIPLQKMGCEPVEVQNVDRYLQYLESDRLDLVIDDRAVIYQALKKYYSSEPDKMNQFRLIKVGFGVGAEYRLMVSTKYPNTKELLEKFNTGLNKIKASGQYKKILKKYGM